MPQTAQPLASLKLAARARDPQREKSNCDCTWRAECCGLRRCLLPRHQATRLYLATGAWVLSHTLTARGHPMGASREERKQTVLEHSSTLFLGLRISFWMLQCRLTQACCLQIKEPKCLGRIAVSSHELHIFTNRETYLISRNHEAAQRGGCRSPECTRGQGPWQLPGCCSL